MATNEVATAPVADSFPSIKSGRAFYESIGSPRYIVAPMVDRSEFAWRMLTRSYMDKEGSKKLLAYTPMLHARLFQAQARFRDDHFQPTKKSLTSKEPSTEKPYLDGNPDIDRPLFVQFCANKPDDFLEAAQYVAPYCDAVDLNLGCPQGIAKSGKYGAFLQEDWDTIYKLINKLHNELSVPITAKMRILETKEKTLDYAKMIVSAGASILTVHGRRREQKGHNTGLADWEMIRYLRDNLPSELVMFANGNILNSEDLEKCLEATGADGIMSAEGNLTDPTIFAKPQTGLNNREYWRGSDGKGGYRLDGVLRRYLDIIYRYVLEQEPPERRPLYVPSDPESESTSTLESRQQEDEPPAKKQKKDSHARNSPSLKFMQGHLFGLLKILFSKHTYIRDLLQRTRPGNMAGFEKILAMIEDETRRALKEEAIKAAEQKNNAAEGENNASEEEKDSEELTPMQRTTLRYGRPWWVCQPHIRPLPEEAIRIGALTVSKKDKAKAVVADDQIPTSKSKDPKGRSDVEKELQNNTELGTVIDEELPKAATVCG